MRLVFHVFVKDARRLRWPVALAIGLTCGWVWAEAWQSDASPGWLGAALQPLLALVWIYLVARVVQEESPAGGPAILADTAILAGWAGGGEGFVCYGVCASSLWAGVYGDCVGAGI